MTPAIEYLLRNNRANSMLTIPTSLFLIGENKIIVTIRNCFGSKKLKITQWNLSDIHSGYMPSFEEYKIEKSELFTSPYIIKPNYHLLEYEDDAYMVGDRQFTDDPVGIRQQIDYEYKLNNIYNSELHKKKKEKWLWECFENSLPNCFLEMVSKNDLKELIESEFKHHWSVWLAWKKNFIFPEKIASELIYKNFFPEKQQYHPYYYGFYSQIAQY